MIEIAKSNGYKIEIKNVYNENGIRKDRVSIDFGGKIVPKPVRLRMTFPCINAYSVFSPVSGLQTALMANFNPLKCESRLAYGAPLKCVLGMDGKNVFTVALSDAAFPVTISTGVFEEEQSMEVKLDVFTYRVDPKSSYEFYVYTDTTDRNYYECINDVCKFWKTECGYTEAYIPQCAKDAVYSSWYSYHQDISADALIEECRAAAELGIKTLIVDDGWQTDSNERGYAYCGDWKPTENKFPDMKAFADEIHKLGMKVVVWYAVPFVGVNSKAYNEFSDMWINNIFKGTITLDPRFKKVREFIANTYRKAIEDWGLDGFKLDFIDFIRIEEDSPEYNSDWDIEDLNAAIDVLMKEISEAITSVNKEAMIEFRQNYIGPTIRKYGNMLRVGDCCCDPIRNRIGMGMLRNISQSTPIHSDMLIWHKEDKAEDAAIEIINCLFMVPQISVRLNELSDSHKRMLKFYLDLWNGNKDVFLDGEMKYYNPESNFSMMSSYNNDKEATVCFVEKTVELKKENAIVVNGTGGGHLTVCVDFDMNIKVLDCMGEVISSGTINKGVNRIAVPKSGVVLAKREG